MPDMTRIRCEAVGCDETHPIDHDQLGQTGFAAGRWLGWIYLDLNRIDLLDRELGFCSAACCTWWLQNQTMLRRRPGLTPLDQALRSAADEVARRRAGLTGGGHG